MKIILFNNPSHNHGPLEKQSSVYEGEQVDESDVKQKPAA
jgi:hypothetical protein